VTRVLVTGASGFLGGAILRRLSDRVDMQVLAAARSDLTDEAAAAAALSATKPDVVIHAAGRTHGAAEALQADNVVATETLARAIAATAPECGLILLGSAAQYGRSMTRTPWREDDAGAPLDAYGLSKLAAESVAFTAARRVTALRIFNVIAAEPTGEQVFSNFLRRAAVARAGEPPRRVEMGALGAVRDFVDVADVLTAVERVIERDAWGEAINVCCGTGRTVRALLEATAAEVDCELTINEASAPQPLLDWSVGDPALCRLRLGFAPSSNLGVLIRQAADWVKTSANERTHA
jgi:nucleoside-diphosphate-sugar epimerase